MSVYNKKELIAAKMTHKKMIGILNPHFDSYIRPQISLYLTQESQEYKPP